MKRLVGIDDELMKIKFICDLPTILKAALESNAGKIVVDFQEAADSY